MLERSASELTLSDQAGLLGVSRSSLYYVSCPPSDWEVRVKHRIDAIYTEQPFYGSRRIQFLLEAEGFAIGRDAVRTFLREMGITAIYPKPNTSSSGATPPIACVQTTHRGVSRREKRKRYVTHFPPRDQSGPKPSIKVGQVGLSKSTLTFYKNLRA